MLDLFSNENLSAFNLFAAEHETVFIARDDYDPEIGKITINKGDFVVVNSNLSMNYEFSPTEIYVGHGKAMNQGHKHTCIVLY